MIIVAMPIGERAAVTNDWCIRANVMMPFKKFTNSNTAGSRQKLFCC